MFSKKVTGACKICPDIWTYDTNEKFSMDRGYSLISNELIGACNIFPDFCVLKKVTGACNNRLSF